MRLLLALLAAPLVFADATGDFAEKLVAATSQVLDVNPNADVVVLSGCETDREVFVVGKVWSG